MEQDDPRDLLKADLLLAGEMKKGGADAASLKQVEDRIRKHVARIEAKK